MAFPLGWQKVCPLTIAAASIAADALTDFPVLLTAACLPSEMVTTGGADASQANGGDIRFSSDASGLTQLACEIVSYVQNASPASATAEIWVCVPSLSGTVDTVIYCWYKSASVVTQPAAAADFGSQAVWDSNYKLIWHGGDGTTLSLSDSTANGNTLTNTGAVTAGAGQVGGAGVFGGASYLSKATPTGVPSSGPITVEAWCKLTNAATNRYAACATLYGGSAASIASVEVETTLKPYAFLNGGVRQATNVISTATWTHIATTLATPFYSIYVNGIKDGSGSQAQVFGAAGITIGALDGPTLYWLGSIDEVRISNTTRSPAWIATQYANHTAPATFTVAGTAYAPGAYADTSGFYGRQQSRT